MPKRWAAQFGEIDGDQRLQAIQHRPIRISQHARSRFLSAASEDLSRQALTTSLDPSQGDAALDAPSSIADYCPTSPM
jgi:hypothetical protein